MSNPTEKPAFSNESQDFIAYFIPEAEPEVIKQLPNGLVKTFSSNGALKKLATPDGSYWLFSDDDTTWFYGKAGERSIVYGDGTIVDYAVDGTKVVTSRFGRILRVFRPDGSKFNGWLWFDRDGKLCEVGDALYGDIASRAE